MTIAGAREKCKGLLTAVPRDVIILAVLVLASSMSFGLGYLAGLEAAGSAPAPAADSLVSSPQAHAGQVVASKNGTKYYLPSCVGADRISDANKVWFVSATAAAAAGYTPAANCK